METVNATKTSQMTSHGAKPANPINPNNPDSVWALASITDRGEVVLTSTAFVEQFAAWLEQRLGDVASDEWFTKCRRVHTVRWTVATLRHWAQVPAPPDVFLMIGVEFTGTLRAIEAIDADVSRELVREALCRFAEYQRFAWQVTREAATLKRLRRSASRDAGACESDDAVRCVSKPSRCCTGGAA